MLAQVFGIDASLDYASRCQQLLEVNVALWDVIGRCQRQGSLDSAIVGSSIHFNPLAEFCQQLPDLQQIWLNGGKAAQSFRQYQRQVQHQQRSADNWPASNLTIRELPSTSPAHASLTFAEKLAVWQFNQQF